MCVEPLDHVLQLDGRRLARKQVRLESARELFVIAAPSLEIEIIPGVQIFQAEPAHERLRVGQDAALAFGQRVSAMNGGRVGDFSGEGGLHFQKKMP